MLFELVSITWGATEVAVAAITIEAATKAVMAAAVVAVAVNQGANIAEDAAKLRAILILLLKDQVERVNTQLIMVMGLISSTEALEKVMEKSLGQILKKHT